MSCEHAMECSPPCRRAVVYGRVDVQPDRVDAKRWDELPRDLRAFFWSEVANRRNHFRRAGSVALEDATQRLVWRIVSRRWAWRRRGAKDARPCGRGCEVELLWRWETDEDGRRRKVGCTRSGALHACGPVVGGSA